MNINRYNYEEYFLLYVDDELHANERREVEAFVEQHPDLEEELAMLKQSTLKADASVVMEDKSHLFKTESPSVITLENYEAFFLLYVDEELNAGERRVVETFAANHPSLQQELHLLLQTKLQTDESIVFPDKNTLYKAPAIAQRSTVKIYRMVAVAAMLLIAAGMFWMMTQGNKGNVNGGLATKETNNTKAGQVAVAKNQETRSQDQVAPAQKEVPQSPNDASSVKRTSRVTLANASRPTKLKQDSGIGKTPIEREIPYDGPPERDVTVQASVPTSTATLALNVQGSDNIANKTLIVDQPVEQTKTQATAMLTRPDANIYEEGGSSEQNKSKLRGFFRQVKRVVEKTTRVPGEETKKLLIGNIEVAVK